MSSAPVVIKLGGSFLLGDGKPATEAIDEMATIIKRVVELGRKVIVVVGGGVPARNYIAAADALGASLGVKDMLGICVSRLNARLFVEALRNVERVDTEPAESLVAVRRSIQTHSVVVCGGLQPGQSTTAVAALCAEYCSASSVIYSTDVDGVYSEDPKKNADAKKLDKVTYRELDKFCCGENTVPGQYRLMDLVALTILERSKIPATILKGSQKNIERYLAGESGIGTIICGAD